MVDVDSLFAAGCDAYVVRNADRNRATLTPPHSLAKLANMITVNMHDAKTRLSELVKAVEERNETVILCRDGVEVAEIRRRVRRRAARTVTPDPRLAVEFAPDYTPTEPLSDDEWPDELR